MFGVWNPSLLAGLLGQAWGNPATTAARNSLFRGNALPFNRRRKTGIAAKATIARQNATGLTVSFNPQSIFLRDCDDPRPLNQGPVRQRQPEFLQPVQQREASRPEAALIRIPKGDTSAVPEPSTWAMMILGFAGVGFTAYQRRKIAVLAA
ncbi:hypothetical protein V1279_001352 [Bradyrhizobium sp. AZCC 1610]